MQKQNVEAKRRSKTQKQTPMNEASTSNHAGFHGRLISYNSYRLRWISRGRGPTFRLQIMQASMDGSMHGWVRWLCAVGRVPLAAYSWLCTVWPVTPCVYHAGVHPRKSLENRTCGPMCIPCRGVYPEKSGEFWWPRGPRESWFPGVPVAVSYLFTVFLLYLFSFLIDYYWR